MVKDMNKKKTEETKGDEKVAESSVKVLSQDELKKILANQTPQGPQSSERIVPVGTIFRMEVSRENRIEVPEKFRFVNLGTRYQPAWHIVVPFGTECEFLAYVNLSKVSVPEDWVKKYTGHSCAEFQELKRKALENK